jgi:CBS domain-containing protein
MGTSVADVMTARPRSATPDTPLEEVAQIMAAEDVGSVPLVDGDRLVGIVTDRDIVVRAISQGKDPRGMPARLAASSELVAVTADQNLDDVLELMARNRVRRLPVVDEGDRLVGIVAQADVARAAKEKATGETLQEISTPPAGPRI